MSAKAKYLRIPPRKARLVADLVRGKSADQATSILRFTTHKGARMIGRALKSAISNVASHGKVDVENLYVKEIFVDPGPILKRFTARAMGKGTRVNKRTSHVTVILGER